MKKRAGLALAFALAAAACHPRPPASAPSARAAQPNRPPSVRARCEPCSVPAGRTATVSAAAQDPDGDRVSYAWTTPGGTLANPSGAETGWTAPLQEGPVPVTVTVTDGRGGIATDAITIQVTKG
jgi:PKD domain-containing protein